MQALAHITPSQTDFLSVPIWCTQQREALRVSKWHSLTFLMHKKNYHAPSPPPLFLGFLWQHLRSIYSQLLSVTLLTDREPARSHYTCSLHVFHHPSPCIISGEDKSFLEEQTRLIRTVKRCSHPLCISICSNKRLS